MKCEIFKGSNGNWTFNDPAGVCTCSQEFFRSTSVPMCQVICDCSTIHDCRECECVNSDYAGPTCGYKVCRQASSGQLLCPRRMGRDVLVDCEKYLSKSRGKETYEECNSKQLPSKESESKQDGNAKRRIRAAAPDRDGYTMSLRPIETAATEVEGDNAELIHNLAVAGVVIGVIALVLLIALLVYCCCFREDDTTTRVSARVQVSESQSGRTSSDSGSSQAGQKPCPGYMITQPPPSESQPRSLRQQSSMTASSDLGQSQGSKPSSQRPSGRDRKSTREQRDRKSIREQRDRRVKAPTCPAKAVPWAPPVQAPTCPAKTAPPVRPKPVEVAPKPVVQSTPPVAEPTPKPPVTQPPIETRTCPAPYKQPPPQTEVPMPPVVEPQAEVGARPPVPYKQAPPLAEVPKLLAELVAAIPQHQMPVKEPPPKIIHPPPIEALAPAPAPAPAQPAPTTAPQEKPQEQPVAVPPSQTPASSPWVEPRQETSPSSKSVEPHDDSVGRVISSASI